MKYILLIDFGSTNTKLTAVDVRSQKLIGTAKATTTVDSDINIGFEKALNALYKKTGKIQFDKMMACSSAAGGLKMAAIGLVEELTVEAAKRVCFGAGGKVDLVFSHYITLSDVEKIKNKKIDIVLLAGGTDGGNSDCVIHNAKMLGKAGIKIPIVYAGNKSCSDEIDAIFKKYQMNAYLTENVMPRLNVLNIDPAREVIRQIFMHNIIVAKGITKIQTQLDDMLLPTPHAVLLAAELLSKGYMHEAGFGDVVLTDIGGATTDVYSMSSGISSRADVILKGLEEPYAKRTVEGDLGMRYSAEGVLQALTSEEQKLFLEQGIDIEKEAKLRTDDIEMIPTSSFEKKVDLVFGEICADIAMSRHVGRMESVYTPLGMMYYQYGKDLTETKYVIGTGGVAIFNQSPQQILQKVCYTQKKPLELRPKNPIFMIDAEYILSAMGLLSNIDPLLALKLMKEHMKVIS